jgi:hypothetical protein
MMKKKTAVRAANFIKNDLIAISIEYNLFPSLNQPMVKINIPVVIPDSINISNLVIA